MAVLIALVGVSASTPAGAEERTKTERYTTIIPVSWEMTPQRCSRLKATTRGSGNMEEKVTIKRHADGSIDVFVSDVVVSSASDDNGVNYRFSYTNHQHAIIPAAPHNDRVYITMSDFFSLKGHNKQGSDPFTIGLVWKWDYTNAGDIPPFTGQWPPERNLVKLATVGDFIVTPAGLDCDPI
jgi:hypothetical protein